MPTKYDVLRNCEKADHLENYFYEALIGIVHVRKGQSLTCDMIKNWLSAAEEWMG